MYVSTMAYPFNHSQRGYKVKALSFRNKASRRRRRRRRSLFFFRASRHKKFTQPHLRPPHYKAEHSKNLIDGMYSSLNIYNLEKVFFGPPSCVTLHATSGPSGNEEGRSLEPIRKRKEGEGKLPHRARGR